MSSSSGRIFVAIRLAVELQSIPKVGVWGGGWVELEWSCWPGVWSSYGCCCDSVTCPHEWLTCLWRFTALGWAVGAWGVVEPGYMCKKTTEKMAVENNSKKCCRMLSVGLEVMNMYVSWLDTLNPAHQTPDCLRMILTAWRWLNYLEMRLTAGGWCQLNGA